MFDKVQSFPSAITLIAFVNELFIVGGLFGSDVSVLEGHNDIKTDIFSSEAFSFGKFVFLDVLDDFFSSQKAG